MVVALGETYEKLERLQEAKKCFWKAHSLGDIEGMALIKLARYGCSTPTIKTTFTLTFSVQVYIEVF